MGRTQEEISDQRGRILSRLGNIVEQAQFIEAEMQNIPHERGATHASLKPISGMYILHGKDGFQAAYQDENGQVYEIKVLKRDSSEPSTPYTQSTPISPEQKLIEHINKERK